jgi:hypothetical protein
MVLRGHITVQYAVFRVQGSYCMRCSGFKGTVQCAVGSSCMRRLFTPLPCKSRHISTTVLGRIPVCISRQAQYFNFNTRSCISRQTQDFKLNTRNFIPRTLRPKCQVRSCTGIPVPVGAARRNRFPLMWETTERQGMRRGICTAYRYYTAYRYSVYLYTDVYLYTVEVFFVPCTVILYTDTVPVPVPRSAVNRAGPLCTTTSTLT